MTLFDIGAGDENGALRDIIAARIRREGPITFAEYMDLALYHPAHGYYLACDPSRDYQSSPNVHPVFAACIARQLAQMWRLMDRPPRFDVLEAGAGNGRLAGEIARWLRTNDPDLYTALAYKVQDAIYAAGGARQVLDAIGLPPDKVEAIPAMASPAGLEGCILSNELLDAFPVHRVRVEGGRLFELRVGLDGDRFVDVPSKPTDEVVCYFDSLSVRPGEGCEAEVNLRARPWLLRAATALKRGYVLTLDYGYEAAGLYAPWRKRGTLLTFYRHTSGDDPYVRVGRQDITASVDFTTLMQAGADAGLLTLGLTTQTELLAALGIGEAVAAPPRRAQLQDYYALRRSVIELTDPAGLGRIRVLAQGKDVPDAALAGFQALDLPRA